MENYRCTVESLKRNVAQFIEDDGAHHIHLGMERKVAEVERHGRIYLNIYCYTLSGKYKGAYKCGCVDKETGEYQVGPYDDVNAETMQWLG